MTTGSETMPVTEPGLPVATGAVTVRELWRFSRGQRGRLAAVVLLGVISTTADLIAPIAIGMLVDGVRDGTAAPSTVVTIIAIMVIGALLGAAGGAITTVLAIRTYQTILARLRERLVDRALNLPQQLVERAGTGDLISRTNDDVTAIADAAPVVVGVLTATLFTILVSLAGLAALEWPYAAAFVVVLPVHALALRWYLRTGPGVYGAERTAMSARTQQIVESQRGYATILGYGLGERRHRTVMNASWAVAVQALRARTVQSMFSARLNLAECLSLAAVLVIGYVLIRNGTSTVGAATTAMLLVLRLLSPIGELLFVFDTIQSAAASLARIIGITTIPEQPEAMRLPRDDDRSVTLHGVAFGYDTGHRVLDGITMTVPAGERLAVVGASGAGKTTLATVIAGIHPPDAGTVSRPEHTVVITQETHVFAGTLRENLTLAAPAATDRDIHAAMEAIGGAGLLSVLPEGLDTPVGDRGQALTDAQAQQIALARVVLAGPDLAIFDEATAEAGSAQSGLLDRAADVALQGRTGIVIAHRLSQAAACDRVVVMEHGRIVEDGDHGALVAAQGTYARLWKAWSAHRPGER